MQLNLFCSIFQNGVCSLENDPTNIETGYVFLLASGNLFVCPKVIHFSRFGGCLCSAVFFRCTQTPAPTSHWPCGSLVCASLHDGEPGGGDPYKVIQFSKDYTTQKTSKDGIHDSCWFVSCMFTTGVPLQKLMFFFPHKPTSSVFKKRYVTAALLGLVLALSLLPRWGLGWNPPFFCVKEGRVLKEHQQ